jgi:hypothetical protein
LKRVAAITIAALGLAVGVGSAVGADGGATIDTFPVSFTVTSAQCSNLPSGATLNGAGTEKSITRTRTVKGVTTISNTSIAHGTATDQTGNTYVFEYNNTFNVSNTVANPAVFSGQMQDHFSLAGGGPAKLSNGFVAAFTTDFGTFFSFVPKTSHGDPIDFSTGAAHCDPL